jgi:hypothetical protein
MAGSGARQCAVIRSAAAQRCQASGQFLPGNAAYLGPGYQAHGQQLICVKNLLPSGSLGADEASERWKTSNGEVEARAGENHNRHDRRDDA